MKDDALSADDRLTILELLARADDAASKRDIETFVALFTEDAYLQGIKGVHRGKDALRAGAPGVWVAEGPASRHLITLRSMPSCTRTPAPVTSPRPQRS